MKRILITTFMILLFAAQTFAVTVYTIGDSTMANKRNPETNKERGWAMVFQSFFDENGVTVKNYAQNGRSSKSFLDENRWQPILDSLQAGDYVFIQFGHNDQKSESEKLYAAADGTYREFLTKYVTETRAKGAYPVLLTSVVRRHFDENGVLLDTHGKYPDAVRELAIELNVPLIDMEKKSRKYIQDLGDEESKKLFMISTGKNDNTHFVEKGALAMAQLAADGICENRLPLCKYVIKKEKREQAPSHLTTDLLEYTDRVFLDGYISNLSLNQLQTAVERYQLAEIYSENPTLGWVVNSDKPNTLQSAYRILVATSADLLAEGKADMWDSEKINSDNSVAVSYDGKPLSPSTVYYWKVKVWDNHGGETSYSKVKSFITAKILDETTARYPLQITNEYPALINKTNEGNQFIDFGKAAFGSLRLTLTSSKENDTITIHLGELAANGRINRKPGGAIRYTSYRLPLIAGTHTYTLKIKPDRKNTNIKANGSGVKPIFMPVYVGEVYPFRYCEIENYHPILTTTNITRRMIHYPFNDNASAFHSSNKVLNEVWDLCKYSIKATSFAGVYVDGDRERIPYEADALINQLCHYSVDREFSMARYSQEYLIHYATWPSEWIMQSVIMAWNDYLYTGNKKSLERFYIDLQAKTLLGLKDENELISTVTGKQTPELLRSIHFSGKKMQDIVDWPQKGVLGLREEDPGEADGFVFTDYNTVVNAYHYHALQLMSRIADTLNKKEDQTYYLKEAKKVKRQINRLLLNTKKGYYKDGIDTDHSSLHANMFPMAFGIVLPKNKRQVSDFIRSRGMGCSVYGSQFLLDAIYEANDAEHGLSLLTSTTDRSWYNMLRVGSTISLEAWDNRYKPNQDWNHAWGAAPANLIPRKLMGIEPLEPGFKKIRIKSQPGSLEQASIRIPTIRGEVVASFANVPGESFVLQVEIPANSSAEVWLPRVVSKYVLKVDGLNQKGRNEGDFVIVNLGSGQHYITIN